MSFDFDALEKRIIAASEEAFRDVAQKYPREEICAFALYSDDGAMTVCPAFDLASALEARVAATRGSKYPNEADVMKFYPPEWKLEAFGADKAFAQICTTVREHVMASSTSRDLLETYSQRDSLPGFAAFKEALFETCLKALEQLRATHAIARRPEVLLLFAVSDSDVSEATERERLKRLNAHAPHLAQFEAWSKTWA